jgi:DNA topoisomerase-2
MTDQDHDGFHIKGLLLNMFHSMWPSLLDKDFISYMNTPIVKVWLKKDIKSFYTLTDYNKWKEKTKNYKKYNIKYYKGLGTSTAKESKEYFKELKLNTYVSPEKELTDKSINLAFNKKQADDRKEWLKKYDENEILDYKIPETKIEDFINKELIHFSNADTCRSIGSCMDGLKTSQRKILYSCFKRKLYSEIRVAQLAGYVSEHAAYHHGEASLQGAIINMAQNFVGSNNINVLMPNGQFGTRIMGGSDSASPRYIHTELNPIVDTIYPKDDMPLLKYTDDDGLLVEPEYYVPIIPMVLVNGMVGIGTGFSTNIPLFNPQKIINNIKRKLNGDKYYVMHPHYNNFKGKIELKPGENNVYITRGVYKVYANDNKVVITELPIGKWTDDYIKFIQDNINLTKDHKNNFITDYENHSTDTEIRIVLKVTDEFIFDSEHSPPKNDGLTYVEKMLKLTSNKSLTNIHLYNSKNQIQKYDTIYKIMDEHYASRYFLYQQRKEYLLEILKNKIIVLESKIKFINEIIDEIIIINKKTRKEIITQLYEKEYILLDDNTIRLTSDIKIEKVGTEYDYLIKMPLYSLSQDKIDELQKELEKNNTEYNILENKSVKDMWTEELNTLTEQLKRFRAN